MSFSLPKFSGFIEHKVDPKYRVAIPALWRTEEGEQFVLQELSKKGVKLIRVLTVQALENAVTSIKNHSKATVGEIREALEELYANILTVSLNAQGKLLIPKEWSERANIKAESSVFLVGRGDYFEIYNATDYPKVDQSQKARVFASMADLGIFSN
jgi:DNA-binding transcriptional regulator/RsmH inhibitor MraZ